MPAYADTIIPTHGTNARSLNNKERMLLNVPKEDVVISGMSGRFPESSTVQEFEENLYNGVDMITENDRRWTPGIYGLPKRSGKLKNLNQFDASFFNVAPKQAHLMDPQMRILLEVTSEAIFDSGIHPNTLRGKNIGVYVGVSVSESEQYFLEDPDKITGYELTGCCRAMFANRISYSFDFKGPSFAVDTACSSSLVAFHAAWKAVNSGEIEGAIVAGSQLCLKPHIALQFNRLNMLSKEGKCRSFDASGNGYVRSEAIAAIFIQRTKDAQRVYANILGANVNTDGNKAKGITFPSSELQAQLLKETYSRAGVDPSMVTYVESHGTGTKAGDPQEANAIAEIFCKNRTKPLLVGSVKSNMGHAEPASGICSIIKVLLAMKRQEIPANLHYTEPNKDIEALLDGRMKVVNENTAFSGQLVGINSFGFGGSNAHIILRSPSYRSARSPECISILPQDRFLERQNKHLVKDGDFPRLVVSCGRTEETVENILRNFRDNRDVHFASLLDNIADADYSTTAYPFRGYTVVGGKSDVEVLQVTEVQEKDTPLWLVFSGMGSQWSGCGKRFMGIPSFANVVQKCRSALIPFGIDVFDIITQEDPDPMLSTTASFTAIAAVQIGLIDTLRAVGLTEFDGYVGHSVGELGCGYVDGTLTAEQTVLAAYWRGRAVEESNLPEGGMAAVGLSAEEAEKWCKSHGSAVVVACHNSANSVTISGPKDEVALLKEKFDAEGIFCREVNSGGIAFHHPSLRKAAPRLLAELQKIILQPLKRSSKWISSSFSEKNWNIGIAKKASAEYLVNNLVSPVLFAEAIEKIPKNARVVEVSPHALMQAVLRRALPECTLVPLVRKEATDPLIHVLKGIGKLYSTGERIQLSALYPKPSSYVPLSTPSIASSIRWDHDIEWEVASFKDSAIKEFNVEIDLSKEEHSYIEGHNIDGRILFPATGYMVLAWKALSKLLNVQWDTMPVTFSDVVLHQATVLNNSNPIKFTVRILLKKGDFEVLAGDGVAASGKIHYDVQKSSDQATLQKIMDNIKVTDDMNTISLEPMDVYKELKLRGYRYAGLFRGIQQADLEGTVGTLEWKSNWVSFLDTMLQFSLLGSPSRALYLPTRIRKITIVPEKLMNTVEKSENSVQIKHNRNISITSVPGVEIHGLKATLAPRRAISDEPILEKYFFLPHCIPANYKFTEEPTDEQLVNILVNLLVENTSSLKVKIAHKHLAEKSKSSPKISSHEMIANIIKSFNTQIGTSFQYSLIDNTLNQEDDAKEKLGELGVEFVEEISIEMASKLNLLVLTNANSTIDSVFDILGNQTFVLVDSSEAKKAIVKKDFVEVAAVEKLQLYLLKKKNTMSIQVMEISDLDTKFEWVEELKQKLATIENVPLWLVSRNENLSGMLGLFKCLRREYSTKKLRCLMDFDGFAQENSSMWKKLIASDLTVNIVKKNVLGAMTYLPLKSLNEEVATHSYLNVLTRGDLSSLRWLAAPTPEPETDVDTVLCHVKYAPLNFRDIMLASGKLPPDALPGNLAEKECILGLEFAGISEDNSRVMGLVAAGGLATTVRADPLLTWKVPDQWTLEEAASVPVVYSTAYYALEIRGKIKKGESILIHAGSGGVGQAAISIALSKGCTVFTTVSSQKKIDFLKERFPQLTDRNFANSRDSSFEYHILEQTQGMGVDLVLNSLAGELLQASVRSLKEHGRFLEIGKADLANNTALGMSIFLKNITFHGILLDALMEGTADQKLELQNIVYVGLESGDVKPLPVTSFKYDQAEDAFRFMASGKHIGKVVLEIQVTKENKKGTTEKSKKQIKKTSQGIASLYRLWPKPSLVYIITGGLGGLGLETAGWLINRGVKKIVLTSRRGVATGYQALCVKRWKSQGVNVIVSTQDCSTKSGAEKLIKDSSAIGQVGGIFHLATVLEDSIFENQTKEKFQRVVKAKAEGAKHLDTVSRSLCPELHLWVTFSSLACGRGNAGQSNYAWANSVIENVVEQRKASGYPACAIQFSGIGDVGVFVANVGEDVELLGTKAQSVRSVLACLDNLIGSGASVVSSMCFTSKNKSSKDSRKKNSLLDAITHILGVKDVTKVPMNASLGDLGVDSLMAVEIKQTLEREIDLILTAEQIRDLTLGKIQEIDNAGGSASQNEEATEAFTWLNYPLVPKERIMKLNNCTNTTVPPVFLTSPIQGTSDVMIEFASGVSHPVYGLNYPSSFASNNITTLAESLIKELETIHPTGPFYLGGYSFGANVAFEIANQLENKGRKPLSLVLLDGSHSYVSGIIQTYRTKHQNMMTKEQQENDKQKGERFGILGESDALVTYTLQFCAINAMQLRDSLMSKKSMEDRLKFVANTVVEKNIKKYPHLTKEEVTSSAIAFLDRLRASFDYKIPEKKLTVTTLLIRASQNKHLETLGEDYGLSTVVEDKIILKEAPGTHESFITGESAKIVATHINEFLTNTKS